MSEEEWSRLLRRVWEAAVLLLGLIYLFWLHWRIMFGEQVAQSQTANQPRTKAMIWQEH